MAKKKKKSRELIAVAIDREEGVEKVSPAPPSSPEL
jgi:hypothetical protein